MKYEISFPKLNITPDISKEIPLEKILAEEMESVRTRIVMDTTAGRRADGGGLKPYKPSYIEAIDSGRVAGKAPGSHTPNLTATQTLLRSFVIRLIRGGAEMTFEGTHPPARRVSAEGAARKRKKAGIVDTTIRRKKTGVRKGGSATPKRAGGSGGDVPNATIAQAQYRMGRTGWMSFSNADLDRIAKRVGDEIDKAIKTLFTKNTQLR